MSLDSIPSSYATVSLGPPSIPLPKKLAAISKAGFQGIELGFPDLLSFASSLEKKQVSNYDYDALCSTASEVKRLCEAERLKVVMLQPFANFEGWAKGSQEREDAFRRVKGWIRIMQSVGCDMLQVGSSDSPHITSSVTELADDLRSLCKDHLAPHGFRLAYENWCWATHAPSWSDVWKIVKLVDQPNIGLCLDTFQTGGGEWGDPTTESGLLEKGANEQNLQADELERSFKDSLERLSKEIPAEKIYILQISDAYKPPAPLSQHPDPPDDSGLRPRGRWSMAFRPPPFQGGYLPVIGVTKAVIGTGFRGWFSMEIFDGGKDGKGKDWEKEGELERYALGAMESHKKLLMECDP